MATRASSPGKTGQTGTAASSSASKAPAKPAPKSSPKLADALKQPAKADDKDKDGKDEKAAPKPTSVDLTTGVASWQIVGEPPKGVKAGKAPVVEEVPRTKDDSAPAARLSHRVRSTGTPPTRHRASHRAQSRGGTIRRRASGSATASPSGRPATSRSR